MTSDADAAEESVVLASFESRSAAERMLASLGRGFRKKARNSKVSAFVVSGNKDGSLKLTESRVLSGSGFASALIHASVSWMVGFMGLFSTLKGARSELRAVHLREAHVGSDETEAHAILAKAGPNGAVALVCCEDVGTRAAVVARAADRASYTWHGARSEFLADLDPGSQMTGCAPRSESRPARAARPRGSARPRTHTAHFTQVRSSCRRSPSPRSRTPAFRPTR